MFSFRLSPRHPSIFAAAFWFCVAAQGAVLLSTSFENDPMANGWTTNGQGRATWTSTESASGTSALAASNSVWMSPFLPTTPLQWYRVAFKSKAGNATNPGSDGDGYWAAEFFDAQGNRLHDDHYSSVFASGSWVSNECRIRAKHTAGTNGTLVPARMKVLFQALNAPLYIDDVVIESTTSEEVARWADATYDTLPAKLTYVPKTTRWSRLPRTLQKLRQGQMLRIVMLGDSVQQDTANAPLDALLQRLYPGATVELISSTRGGTGVQYYKDHVGEYVLGYQPDLLVIGGISHEENLASWQSVVGQVRADDAWRGRTTEILILTPQWSPNNNTANSYFLAPGMTELDPVPTNNVSIPNDKRGRLLTFCATNNIEFLDMTGIASQFIYGPATAAGVGSPNATGAPYGYWMRDWVHANDRAKMILGRTLEAYFAPPPTMRVSATGGQVTLMWPVAAAGYHIEAAGTLGTNRVWNSNAVVNTSTNGHTVVTQPVSGGSRFYRLRRPQ